MNFVTKKNPKEIHSIWLAHSFQMGEENHQPDTEGGHFPVRMTTLELETRVMSGKNEIDKHIQSCKMK